MWLWMWTYKYKINLITEFPFNDSTDKNTKVISTIFFTYKNLNIAINERVKEKANVMNLCLFYVLSVCSI